MVTTKTASQFNHEASKILGQAERGDTIEIEKHGEPCAVIIPHPRRTSGAEMARRLEALRPRQAGHRAAAGVVEKLIKGMDDASRRSFGVD